MNKKDLTVEVSNNSAKLAGEYISDILALNVEKDILLMFAGGSSRHVFDFINPQYFGSHITVTVTDDRYTEDLEENNFAVMQTYPIYRELINSEAFCIDTQIYGAETLSGSAERFEYNLRQWKKDFPNGVVVALFGIGANGHIGGIIPGVLSDAEFKKMYDGERWVGYMDSGEGTSISQRISTTFPFMRAIDHSAFYVTGETKREALEKVLADSGTLEATPARIMREMKNTCLFTDLEGLKS